MERLKFRAWHKVLKQMYDVEKMVWENGEPVLVNTGEAGVLYDIEAFELMQCVGIKDKSGQLIYEGDIVGWESDTLPPLHIKFPSIVTWHYAMLCFTNKRGGTADMNWLHSLEMPLIVLGNIFNNPEFLEGTE